MASQTALFDPLFLAFQQVLAGRYSIDRELGRGGMGVVYLAREVHLDRLVAIKLLPPERASDESLRERFLLEARLAAKLSHPNIIPIHAVEETGGFVYFVMAFVDGETLDQRVRTRGPLSSAEGARVLREVAWALAYAHGQGLVHRDVKPENILLEAATGRVLVADFGIAAVAGDDAVGGVSGTPEFMSPEQALGGSIDARSDLYGLGATAFFLFTGRFLFEGSTVTEILARHVTEAAPPLATIATTLPRKIAGLVDRCLSKSPSERPESATALADQLGVALEARRELPVALRSFVRRQSRLNGGGTLIAGTLLLPTVIGASSMFGGEAGWATLALGTIGAPFAYFVTVARRLRAQGFEHADIGPAFRREIEQAQEELAVESRVGLRTLERWLPLTTRVSLGVSVVSLLAAFLSPHILDSRAFQVFSLSQGWTVLGTVGLVALKQRHEDVDTRFWSKLWMGRIGRAAFAIARKVPGRQARTAAMTHRATELSLGMAAEQLFESLPRETRQSLGDVPELVRRLQGDAQLMRRRYDELQGALAETGDGTAEAHADVRAARDAVQAKLSDAVTALETIRLNLLRLHAGQSTVEGLTTHLGMAEQVSAEVQRLIAAHQEIADSLRAPRLLSTSLT